MCDDKRGVKNKTSDNNGCNPLEECCHLIFMNHAIGILFQLSFNVYFILLCLACLTRFVLKFIKLLMKFRFFTIYANCSFNKAYKGQRVYKV